MTVTSSNSRVYCLLVVAAVISVITAITPMSYATTTTTDTPAVTGTTIWPTTPPQYLEIVVGDRSFYNGSNTDFEISDLPDGEYTVGVRFTGGNGTTTVYAPGTLDKDKAQRFTVNDTSTPRVTIDINKAGFGTVTGKFTDPDRGERWLILAPTAVRLEPEVLDPAERNDLLSPQTITEDDGSFTIPYVLPGRYLSHILPRFFAVRAGSFPLEAAYYYPGTIHRNQATAVTVRANETVHIGEMTLPRYSVSGKVSLPPLTEKYKVIVTYDDPALGSIDPEFPVWQEGDLFTVYGLFPGKYTFRFLGSTPGVEATHSVTVTDSDVFGLNITMTDESERVEISGTVNIGDKPLPEGSRLMVRASTEYEVDSQTVPVIDGKFTVPALVDSEYVIDAFAVVGPPKGLPLERSGTKVTTGRVALSGIDVNLSRTNTISGLVKYDPHQYTTLYLGSRSYSMTASLYDSSGKLLKDVTPDPRDIKENEYFYFRDLADGDYYVAFGRRYVPQRFGLNPFVAPTFWAKNVNEPLTSHQAQRITVRDGVVQTGINATLQRGGTIVGKIVDADGKPVTGATIRTITRGEFFGKLSEETSMAFDFHRQTKGYSSDGMFNLDSLAPGTYLVAVTTDDGHNYVYNGSVNNPDLSPDITVRANHTVDIGAIKLGDAAPAPAWPKPDITQIPSTPTPTPSPQPTYSPSPHPSSSPTSLVSN